ncbi:hypothetical protein H4R19_001737 [Coemansia spiralis]|nr:hypothetical protein H4R19_001737 [Coemansia spiralis]
MTRGNQRDLARQKNQKKQDKQGKEKDKDGLSHSQRKELDAQRMREKQAKKTAGEPEAAKK